MQNLLLKHGPAPFQPHPFKPKPAYPTLLSSIVGQQLFGKAAETIWKRLTARFAVEPEVLYQARLEDLRAVGLSSAKARYVQDLSRFALEGGLDGIEHRSDQEIVRHLTQVKDNRGMVGADVFDVRPGPTRRVAGAGPGHPYGRREALWCDRVSCAGRTGRAVPPLPFPCCLVSVACTGVLEAGSQHRSREPVGLTRQESWRSTSNKYFPGRSMTESSPAKNARGSISMARSVPGWLAFPKTRCL